MASHKSITLTFAIILIAGVIGAQAGVCPINWAESVVSGKCFRLIGGPYGPTEGSKICKDLGGNLASIESEAENNFITKTFGPAAVDWVIVGGIRQPLNTGTFTWEDGTPWSYQNWGTPSGNAAVTNNYFYLYLKPNHKGTPNYGKWYGDTAIKHEILCQLRVSPTDSKASCPSPSPAHNGDSAGGCGCGGGCGCNNAASVSSGCGSCGCGSCKTCC